MAEERYIRRTCDMCGFEVLAPEDYETSLKPRRLPVKFITEQTEGTSVDEPYIDMVNLNLCEECYKKFLDNYPIKAVGCRGYNEFYWNDKHITLIR